MAAFSGRASALLAAVAGTITAAVATDGTRGSGSWKLRGGAATALDEPAGRYGRYVRTLLKVALQCNAVAAAGCQVRPLARPAPHLTHKTRVPALWCRLCGAGSTVVPYTLRIHCKSAIVITRNLGPRTG